ncbi:hypothetical protein GDO81_015869 [Engystomops pustulosus]|uniref:Uncharacterized protein n=1 Tax=Engystomops pustulosus TaxID=76066 RepID=A0AAV7ATS1_ENGPU|nr:hypothetical protein GDO81_015869 [Engystomops pustulosus]
MYLYFYLLGASAFPCCPHAALCIATQLPVSHFFSMSWQPTLCLFSLSLSLTDTGGGQDKSSSPATGPSFLSVHRHVNKDPESLHTALKEALGMMNQLKNIQRFLLLRQ